MDKSILAKLKKMHEMDIALFVAIFLGLLVAIFIITIAIPQTSYFTSVYIIPGSYATYPSGDKISFGYGVRSLFEQKTVYTLEFYANSNLIDSRQIDLNPSESIEGVKIIDLPEDIQYPVKIKILAIAPEQTNEAHFWVKKEGPL